MNEITLEQFQLEIVLCYHSQNNIPSFVKNSLKTFNIVSTPFNYLTAPITVKL